MDESAAADNTAHGPRLHPALRQKVASGQLLDLLPIGVHCCDAEGWVVQFNRRATELWGRTPPPGDGTVRFCGSARLFLPDGRPVRHAETPMAEVLRTGVPARDQTAIIERPDGSRITVLANIDPVFDDDGVLVGAVNCFQDISELRRAQDALEAKERHLHALLEALPAAVYTTDAAGRITFYNEAAVELAGRRPELGSEAWCVSWRLYWPDGTPMPHDQCPMAMALSEQQPIRGMEAIAERPDGSRVPLIPYPSPLFDETGALVGAVNMLVDITERKQAEESQQLLISELNHRVKNTLAIIQAIANQTLRRARSPAEFASSFSGRVQALSQAHALLTQTTWSGAEIGALVRDQLLLGVADHQRIAYSGPALMLAPQTALHMALVLHELGTNARKYGALSVAEGRLAVSWELHSGPERVLLLLWRETGGPAVSAPSVRGFGSVLIEQSLRSHGGDVSVQYAANGIVCQIRLPLPEQVRRRPGGLDAAEEARALTVAGPHPSGRACRRPDASSSARRAPSPGPGS